MDTIKLSDSLASAKNYATPTKRPAKQPSIGHEFNHLDGDQYRMEFGRKNTPDMVNPLATDESLSPKRLQTTQVKKRRRIINIAEMSAQQQAKSQGKGDSVLNGGNDEYLPEEQFF